MAGKNMKLIQEKLAAKQEQQRILEAEIQLLKNLLAEMNGEASEAAPRKRAPRSNVKNVVLAMLQEVGGSGLNAAIVVDMAEKRGEKLDRGSVSSLLSRLKSEGVVTYDGDRYKLAEPPMNSDDGWGRQGASVHPHPASRSMP